MSPWVDLDRGAQKLGQKYVFSYKLSPAIFSEDRWDSAAIKNKLQKDLEKIKGCHVEIIIKDISTVKRQPQRLWEWAKIAMEVVEHI